MYIYIYIYIYSLHIYQREGDNYPNGLTKLPGRDGGTGPLGNAIVSSLCCRRVALLPLLVGKDEQDLGRKTLGVGVRAG